MSVEYDRYGLARVAPPLYSGYFDLGPIQIPPRITFIGFTDRVTGTVYYLSWDGVTHLQLVTTAPSGLNTRVFAAHDGPFLGNFGIKLGVSNGRIVIDTSAKDSGPPVFAFNSLAPFQQIYPEPTNYPAPLPPVIPGIPDTSPTPSGGGYAAYQAAFPNVLPPPLNPIWDGTKWGRLGFYAP
jgi:hypothetical protein